MSKGQTGRVIESMYRFVADNRKWAHLKARSGKPKTVKTFVIRFWTKPDVSPNWLGKVIQDAIEMVDSEPEPLATYMADADREKINAVEVLNSDTLEGTVAYNDWP